MQIRFFHADDFPEYSSWFADPVLNKELGPLDTEWLEAIMSENPVSQFAVISGEELVAVVGVAVPEDDHWQYVITDVSVRPDLKGQGIGRVAIEMTTDQYSLTEDQRWTTYVGKKNQAAQDFFHKLSWTSTGRPDESGMIEYQKA